MKRIGIFINFLIVVLLHNNTLNNFHGIKANQFLHRIKDSDDSSDFYAIYF